MRFLVMICAMAAGLGLLPRGGLAQTMELRESRGMAVVTQDRAAGAAEACGAHGAPVVLTLSMESDRGVHLRGRPREGKGNAVRVNKGLVRVRKGERDGPRLGINFDSTSPLPGKSGAFTLSGQIEACLSDSDFTVRGGKLDVEGQKDGRAVAFHEDFAALTGRLGAGLRMWMKREVYKAGPQEVARAIRVPAGKGYEKMDYVGELELATSAFPWRFAPLEAGQEAVDWQLEFAWLQFHVMDAR